MKKEITVWYAKNKHVYKHICKKVTHKISKVTHNNMGLTRKMELEGTNMKESQEASALVNCLISVEGTCVHILLIKLI